MENIYGEITDYKLTRKPSAISEIGNRIFSDRISIQLSHILIYCVNFFFNGEIALLSWSNKVFSLYLTVSICDISTFLVKFGREFLFFKIYSGKFFFYGEIALLSWSNRVFSLYFRVSSCGISAFLLKF